MTPQETVDRIARLAKPRIESLLRLQSVEHIHDPVPGDLQSTTVHNGQTIVYDRMKEALQPYKDLERFNTEERVMSRIIDLGLLPIVTALMQAIRAKRYLVTRNIARKSTDKGVQAHIEGIGVRISLYFDARTGDTIVAWHSLHGVA